MNSLTRQFLWVAVATIAAVYFLILVGGTVRATGAGMGCPDWPTCFGKLIPPTQEAQLPPDWRVRYAARGYDTADFDPIKTWTEFVNRLVGVTIGLMSIATVALAWRIRAQGAVVFWAALGGLFFVCLNGWIGSMVVASNLRPVMVSLHMTGAFLVQMCFIYAVVRATASRWQGAEGPSGLSVRPPDLAAAVSYAALPSWFRQLVLWSLAALTLQIFLGIQIRESVDLIARAAQDVGRADWIEAVPYVLYVHRSFSWVVLALVAWLVWRVIRSPHGQGPLGRMVWLLLALVVFEMMLGGALNHLGFPLVAQPMHLLTAHLIFGMLWFLWCALAPSRAPAVPLSQPSYRTSHV
jgi:cytochrome c oxidase assembly protein subunit 15